MRGLTGEPIGKLNGGNMKIFISMPMNGKTDEEIKEELSFIRESNVVLRSLSDDIVWLDGFDESYTEENEPVEFLAKSIASLAKADVVYFARGWEKARGCRIEHEVAVAYGKECYYA